MGTQARAITADQLRELPPPATGKWYELSEGELILVGHNSSRHEDIKMQIAFLIREYLNRNPIGRVYADTGYTLTPETVRIPDVSFIADEKRKFVRPNRPFALAPDIAVEVISESETARDAEKKIREYLAAGVREVWQLYDNLARLSQN